MGHRMELSETYYGMQIRALPGIPSIRHGYLTIHNEGIAAPFAG